MDKETFTKRLVELRIKKGVSARDMSLSIGQSAGYINNIENGVNYSLSKRNKRLLAIQSKNGTNKKSDP